MTAVKLATLEAGKRETGEAVSGEAVSGAGGSGARVRDFVGDLREVGAARRFVAGVLDGSPARDMLLICVSELAANAIEHTESGAGGIFTVTVGQSIGKLTGHSRGGTAFVAVTDEGSAGEPGVRRAGDMSEGGRGLALVDACSSRWGYRDSARGRTVWAEVTWQSEEPETTDSRPMGADSRPMTKIVILSWTARLFPLTVDGLIYASSMVMLDSARRKSLVPGLARWLLRLGIAATLSRPPWPMAWGTGLLVRRRRGRRSHSRLLRVAHDGYPQFAGGTGWRIRRRGPRTRK